MKELLRNILKSSYYALPSRLRFRLFRLVFRSELAREALKPAVLSELQTVGHRAGSPDGIPSRKLHPLDDSDYPSATVLEPFVNRAQRTFKLGIVIHAYHIELLPGILEKLENIRGEYGLYLTTPAAKVRELERCLNGSGLEAKIHVSKNQGYDLLPLIDLLPDLLDDGVEVICKLHTKKGGANLEHLYPDIGQTWSDLLMDPIISTPQIVEDVLSAFESDPNLGMIGSASLYKSVRHLMYGNEHYVTNLLERIDGLAPRSLSDWGFFAGSMFWCRTSVLAPLLKCGTLSGGGESEGTGQIASPWHALERILGLLPSMGGKKVGLSFAIDEPRMCFRLVVPAFGEERGFINTYGVGLSLVAELSIHEDLQLLTNKVPEHDCAASFGTRLGMDPRLYYLRYGVFLGQELLPSFNSHTYWHQYPDVLAKRWNPLAHFLRWGESEGRTRFPARENIEAAMTLIRRSGKFDAAYYERENPEVVYNDIDPLLHFCREGWLELKDPNPSFDVWNYWHQHLDVNRALINPLVHNLLLEPDSVSQDGKIRLSEGFRFQEGQAVSRVCLFAAYDPEDKIDQSVIDYLVELAKFADIYYLADGNMAAGELGKLANIVKGAWSVRHGEYDFGSYSRLARDLVGWETIEQYDELILANDSCYLVGSFDPVFKKMRRSACDWWGLQATKGIWKTRKKSGNRFKRAIPIVYVKENLLEKFESEVFYDFHVGSYFVVFRRPVLQSPELKRVLGSVQLEANKLSVIRKYEIGLTRVLINAGFDFDTFVDDLCPFHPLYSENQFELIRNGFPLFKRFLLTENHYHIPELHTWERKLMSICPELDLAAIKQNLLRVSNHEKLYRNLNLKKSWRGKSYCPKPLSGLRLKAQDRLVPKNPDWWAFPVCAYDHSLSGNDRAVFEAVKNNPDIKKIVLTRSKYFDGGGRNVEVAPLKSVRGQELLIRSKVIFIKHSVVENVEYELSPKSHLFINLWHGIPIKRIGYASLDLKDRLGGVAKEHQKLAAVICSSEIDRMAMTAAFYPLSYSDIWVTGLPRIDFVLCEESRLPSDMRADLQRLEESLAGRRLLFFCPTFKNQQDSAYFRFSYEQKVRLRHYLDRNNFVLGIREHMAAAANSYLSNLGDLPILNLGSEYFRHVELIYRKTDVLITDYSSCLVDFMVTGKPILSFAYDLEYYENEERGLFYDLEFVVPGPVCLNFDQLIVALENFAAVSSATPTAESYRQKRRLFFKYLDDNNAERVVGRINELLHGQGK